VGVDDADRYRLLGSYKTPRFRLGQRVRCEVLGEIVICGLSEAPIPWPVCRRGRGAHRVPVVYKGLARAVRRESEQAVCWWWGVGQWCVWHWRRALGVGRKTEATSRLHRDYG
jgi:hypothetical protein